MNTLPNFTRISDLRQYVDELSKLHTELSNAISAMSVVSHAVYSCRNLPGPDSAKLVVIHEGVAKTMEQTFVYTRSVYETWKEAHKTLENWEKQIKEDAELNSLVELEEGFDASHF